MVISDTVSKTTNLSMLAIVTIVSLNVNERLSHMIAQLLNFNAVILYFSYIS